MDRMSVRNALIEHRRDLTDDSVARMSRLITDYAISTVDWERARSVHVYRSVPGWREVDTTELLAYIGTSWPNIAVTIGEPDKSAVISRKQYDVIIMPLVAFDHHLNRLGFGGGWYDRFLSGQKGAAKIGLAYAFQLIDVIEAHANDVPLDMVVTENGVMTPTG